MVTVLLCIAVWQPAGEAGGDPPLCPHLQPAAAGGPGRPRSQAGASHSGAVPFYSLVCYSVPQSHLAENQPECRWVKELEPDCQSYTEVYHRAGLLTPRTVLAHCVHLSQVLHLYTV